MFKILVNHMGYSVGKPKKVVVQTDGQELKRLGFSILRQDGTRAYAGKLVPYGEVASWHTGSYYAGSFDSLDEEGVFTIRIGASVSESFEITAHSATMRLMNAVTYYFKAQRDSGEWLLDDSALPFAGERDGIVDAHGGWYDATGDYGIHLSHLSHSTYYNPQQVQIRKVKGWAVELARAKEALQLVATRVQNRARDIRPRWVSKADRCHCNAVCLSLVSKTGTVWSTRP